MAALKTLRKYLPYLGIFLLALAAGELWARPGGGNSFGGGSGGSFGGGGDGDGLGAIIYLIVRYPQIGIPLLVIFILYRVYTSRNAPKEELSSSRTQPARRNRYLGVVQELEAYQQEDKHFSLPLFMDFAQLLYFRLHHLRGTPEFKNLSAFFSTEVLQHELRMLRSGAGVSELVIGAMRITDFQQNSTYDAITLEIEASFTETNHGHSNRLDVVDQWIMIRNKGVQSKGPEEMMELACPNCGSPVEVGEDMACKHCTQVVPAGTKHWQLARMRHLKRKVQRGQQFGHYEQEQGTHMPTVLDPQLKQKGMAFLQQHGIQDFGSYFAELRDHVIVPVFKQVYQSWEQREYEAVRPLVTDNLFRSHLYWVNAYKENGLVNRLRDLQVHDVTLAKIELDLYYETFTVRIKASVFDFLETEAGKHMGGDIRQRRLFTEYWTFIRRTGVEKNESKFKIDACPNCGAPVDMGMTGICSYCNSKVTSGDFGWVLSRITQDEVYYG